MSYFQLLAAGQGLGGNAWARNIWRCATVRNRAKRDLPGRDLYVTFTLDLTPGPEKLLKNLPRDTRYAIRKSQKAGLAWTEDLTDRDFYEIYAQSVHRLGTPVFSRELFLALRREFPRSCRLFGVRKGNAAIAGVLCFYFRDQVLPYYGGSIAESHRDSPNNFMYWSLIEQSSREGCRGFDFGRSKKGTGSFDFKSAWSMEVERTSVPLPTRESEGNSAPEPCRREVSTADRGLEKAPIVMDEDHRPDGDSMDTIDLKRDDNRRVAQRSERPA